MKKLCAAFVVAAMASVLASVSAIHGQVPPATASAPSAAFIPSDAENVLIDKTEPLTLAVDQCPKEITVMRRTRLVLTGTVPPSVTSSSSAASSTNVILKADDFGACQARITDTGGYHVFFDTGYAKHEAYTVSVAALQPGSYSAYVSPPLAMVKVHLRDEDPLTVALPQHRATYSGSVPVQFSLADRSLDVSHYAVYVDNADAHIALDAEGKGTISLAGKKRGIHVVRIRATLAHDAGDVFSESVPIRVRDVVPTAQTAQADTNPKQ